MRVGAQTVRMVLWLWAVGNHAHTAPGTIGMGPSVVLERQEGHARAQILAARPAGTTRGDYGYHGVHTGRARQQRAGRGGDACGCACGATGEAHHVLGGKLSGGRGGRSWVGGDVGATSAVGGALGAVGRTPGLAGGCAGRACSVGWGASDGHEPAAPPRLRSTHTPEGRRTPKNQRGKDLGRLRPVRGWSCVRSAGGGARVGRAHDGKHTRHGLGERSKPTRIGVG